jgi:hypothetical protein
MTQFAKKAALVMLTVAAIAGCKKNPYNNGSATKTQMLSSGAWKITSDYVDPPIDINGDGRPVYELINSYPSCRTDDLFFFNADGTYVHDEGASKCNPSNPQIEERSNWKLSADESIILIGDPGSEYPAHVIELSSSVFKMKYIDTVAGVINSELITFKH